MVTYCVAFGCTNDHYKSKIPFHTFPFKRPEILKLWIQALRRDNWVPSKTSKLCGEHFLPTDYIVKPGLSVKLLKPNAVPSVFSFPKHLLPKVTVPRRKILKQPIYTIPDKTENEFMDIDLPSTSTAPVKLRLNKETQTVPNNTVARLRRKVKTLKQKVNRREVKISSMKDVISAIKKSGHSNESLDTVLNKYFEGLPLELVLLQKQKGEGANPGQRRYSALMKQFAHTLYFYSPKAYKFLCAT